MHKEIYDGIGYERIDPRDCVTEEARGWVVLTWVSVGSEESLEGG